MPFVISQLYIYPIKGMAGIPVQEAYVEELGLRFDRRWLLIDAAGVFLSQRSFPELCLFKGKLLNDKLEVEYKGSAIEIPLSGHSGMKVQSSVWESEIVSYEVSPVISQWFSDMLKTEVKLVTRGEASIRRKTLLKPPYEVEVSYADAYPILGLGTASLHALEKRLGYDLSVLRFRPNIYFKTVVPFEEDELEDLATGEIALRVIKPCARCQVVDIDPTSSVSGKEVLKELSIFRKDGNKVLFGVNMIALSEGWLRVGEELK